jgi:hypothetical protein
VAGHTRGGPSIEPTRVRTAFGSKFSSVFEKSPGTDGRTKASAPGLRSRDGADPEAGLDMGKGAHVTSLADPARLVKHDGIVQPPT